MHTYKQEMSSGTGTGSNAHAGGLTRTYMHTYQAELEKVQQQNEALRQQLETEQEEMKVDKTKIQVQRAARGSKEMEHVSSSSYDMLRSKIIAHTIGKWINQSLAGAVSLWTQHTLENRQLRCVGVFMCARTHAQRIECTRVRVFHAYSHTYIRINKIYSIIIFVFFWVKSL